jgi:mannosyltransferase OCH1-like enzyme
MQQQAEAEGFTVNYVSDSNLHQFIDSNTLLKIENTIHSAKMIILPQTKSDFYRLALIAEHGGVYLDATYYFVRNFSWITHISEYPPNQIFNRFD